MGGVAIVAGLAGCGGTDSTAPDHCQTEMASQKEHRGSPQQIDQGPAYERWTYTDSQLGPYVVFFDWSSGSCHVSYPQTP